MPITPKLLVPPYDAQPQSRQQLGTVGMIFNGSDGLNIAPQVIAANSAVKTGLIYAPGFDTLEFVADIAQSGGQTQALVVAIIVCDESGAEIVEEVLGQIPGGDAQHAGKVFAAYPGLYLFKLKFYGADGAVNLALVRWLKLSKS